jgi:histidinol-phosphatase (PHP family)
MKPFNFHTHSFHCDGSSKPEDYVQKALEFELSAIGFSSHAPVPFDNTWSIKPGKLSDYENDIRKIVDVYRNSIPVYLSLEMDYIPEVTQSFQSYSEKCKLDYTIGGVHLVKNPKNGLLWFIDGPIEGYEKGLKEIFAYDIKKGVSAFYSQTREMIETQKPDIVAHFDKIKMNNKNRFFSTDEKWYISEVDKTLESFKKHGTIVEVNTRGIYKGKTDELFPSVGVLKKCHQLNIPVTIGTDAHHPEDLNKYFNETVEILEKIGIRSLKFFKSDRWIDLPLN